MGISRLWVFLFVLPGGLAAQVLTCDNKVLESISLEEQFQPTRGQSGLGNCYAHSALALTEAAIFRNTGEHVALDFDAIMARKILNDPSAVRRMKRSDDPASALLGGEGGRSVSFLKYLESQGKVLPRQVWRSASIAQVKQGLDFALKDTSLLKLSNDDWRKALRALLEPIDNASPKLDLSAHVKDFETRNLFGSSFKLGVRGLRAQKFDPSSNQALACETYKKDFEVIRQSLCRGLPVHVAFQTKGMTELSGENSGNHGAIIQGIEADGLGNLHYILRNSGFDGSIKSPGSANSFGQSLLRIPVEESCRIFEAFVYEGASDQKRTESETVGIKKVYKLQSENSESRRNRDH